MAKPIMNDKDRKKYDRYLLEIIKEKYALSQQEYYNIVKEAFPAYKFSISKFRSDFKRLNIKRVKEDDRMVYKHVKPEEKSDMPVEFSMYIRSKPVHWNNFYCLKLRVSEGTESIICKKLFEKYSTTNAIYVPAYQSVCVISPKLNVITTIKKDISSLLTEK